jgi:hypothetical protein
MLAASRCCMISTTWEGKRGEDKGEEEDGRKDEMEGD